MTQKRIEVQSVTTTTMALPAHKAEQWNAASKSRTPDTSHFLVQPKNKPGAAQHIPTAQRQVDPASLTPAQALAQQMAKMPVVQPVEFNGEPVQSKQTPSAPAQPQMKTGHRMPISPLPSNAPAPAGHTHIGTANIDMDIMSLLDRPVATPTKTHPLIHGGALPENAPDSVKREAEAYARTAGVSVQQTEAPAQAPTPLKPLTMTLSSAEAGPHVPVDQTPLGAAIAAAQHTDIVYETPIESDGQVPNTMPGFTNAVSDGEYASLALPSRFGFYAFKDLYVKPLLTRHIAKLRRAHNEKTMLPAIEAISEVVYTTDPDYQGRAMGFELTLPDFLYVLYWLRMNSFTKSNFVHRTVCENEAHIAAVENWLEANDLIEISKKRALTEAETTRWNELQDLPKAEDKTLKIAEVVRNSHIHVQELAKVPDPQDFCFPDAPTLFMRPPIMRDLVEMAEAPQMRDPSQVEEYSMLFELASHFQDSQTYLTLEQRSEIAGATSPDQMKMIEEFQQLVAEYGVNETINVTCKHCQATRPSKINLGVHSFFL